MCEEFKEYINYFLDKRLNEIIVNLRKRDVDFNQMQIKSKKLQDELINKEDEEIQQLFMKYEEENSEQMAILYSELYTQGFKDSIKIMEIIKR